MTAPISDSDEETPLLPPSPPETRTLESFPRPPQPHRTSSFIHQAHSPRAITAMIIAVLFILEFGSYLMTVPGLRIYEDIICHKKLGIDGDIDESLCKGEEVQNELSVLVAGLHFIGAIPSLVTTIPYGLLADRIGRKPVFMLSLMGLVLCVCYQMIIMWFWKTLPLRLVWVGPILTLIGGGQAVASMMFYAIASDITAEANRANIFMLGVSAGLVAQFFGPSVTLVLMKTSNWMSMLLGLAMITLGFFLFFLIPETLHMRPRPSNPSHLTPSVSNLDLPTSDSSKKSTSLLRAIKNEFASSLKSLTSSLEILSSTPTLLLLLTFVIQPFTQQSVDLSLRYISTRFHFPLRFSSLILSLRAAISILLLLLILPLTSHFLTTRLSYPTAKKDLFLARLSIILLTLGLLLIASSPTLPLTIIGMTIFTLGTGYIALTRSLITSTIAKERIGELYALISVVEVVGALVAGPGLAQMYILGLRWGGGWVGLPFWGVAGVCGLGAVAILIAGWMMRNASQEDGDGEEEELLVGLDEETDIPGVSVGTVNAV